MTEIFMHPRHFKTGILFLAFLCFGIGIKAQESEEFQKYKSVYPDARSVRLLQHTDIEIALKGEEIEITQEFTEEDLYLDESAQYGTKRSINFSSFFELEEIEAVSYNYENGKYHEFKVEEFKEKNELDRFFYDDTKSLNFIFPNLKKGSKSRINYSEKVKNPRFIGAFYFADMAPIVQNRVTIKADNDIQLRFLEFNTETYDIQFKKEVKRNYTLYSWELLHADEFDFEENISSYQKVMPHIIPLITSYKVDGEEHMLLGDVRDLYSWYYSLVKDINREAPDPAMVRLVNDLVKDKKTDLEKVKALYYWTQQHIKYIAFEYALGGFIPREANDVFQKKYGDCKDNSSILKEMLEIAGLKGDLTWIGTRDISYSYTEVPSPLVDNHMILSYTEGDTTYFLDATGSHLPLGYPSSFIQGKEALIANGENDFIIKEVPVIPAGQNLYSEHVIVSIAGDSLNGQAHTEISGYKKEDIFNTLEGLTKQEDLTEFYNSYMRKGSNRFLVENVQTENKYSYDKNFILDYEFTIASYVKNLGDEIFVNLNLNKDVLHLRTKPDRKLEKDFSYKHLFEYKTELMIPEGYTVSYVPEAVNISNDLLETSVRYELLEDRIIYYHSAKLNFLTLSLSELSAINEMVQQMEKAYKEIIILTKK